MCTTQITNKNLNEIAKLAKHDEEAKEAFLDVQERNKLLQNYILKLRGKRQQWMQIEAEDFVAEVVLCLYEKVLDEQNPDECTITQYIAMNLRTESYIGRRLIKNYRNGQRIKNEDYTKETSIDGMLERSADGECSVDDILQISEKENGYQKIEQQMDVETLAGVVAQAIGQPVEDVLKYLTMPRIDKYTDKQTRARKKIATAICNHKQQLLNALTFYGYDEWI